MKFSEMTYTRPDPAASKQRLSALTAELKAAKSYEEARKVFLSQQGLMSHISTAATLASIRHSIDTRDEFYDGEEKFWNNFNPELEEYNQAWTAAMLESAFRADFEKEYGDLMFVNAEIALKTFSPAIIPELQQENDLTQEYEKLLASAQIPFEGKVYTLSQLSPFKTCADDEKRLAAWKAEGQWYKDNQAKFDELYDKLVKLRDAMGKKLGYEGYTTLGYYRMGRNCYTKDDVEKFREAVVKYLVPVADKVYREQAKRLGKLIVAHCEDNSLLRGGYIHDGAYARAHGHRGICSESEWRPIQRDLELVRETGCGYHVCHISTKESVALIRKAKAEGLNVTCETGPHYLVMDDSDLQEDGRFKMNPPLRDKSDREALLEGLADGTIDMIATDHAPHSAEEKGRGLEKSAMGIVGLETAFPLLYTYLVKPGVISMERLMELLHDAPCRRFNIPTDTGFTVFDLNDSYRVDPADFLSMGKATPFTGWEVQGRCLLTAAGETAVWYDADRLLKGE